jgi:hypothetical protein
VYFLGMRLLEGFRLRRLARLRQVQRSAFAIGLGLLAAVAFLFDCGGSSFMGASGGSSGVGVGVGGIGQGGAVGASGGDAGVLERGGGSSGGSSGGAQDGGGHAGALATAGKGGVSTGGAVGVSGGGAVGAGGAPTSVCPAAPPNNDACVSGLICTYGMDLRPACRTRYECMNKLWTVSGTACAPLIACLDRDAGIPHPGDECTSVGEDCTLGDEAQGGPVYCRCDACVGAECSPKWDCIGPPLKPCLAIPPNEGQACDTNGQSCSYGSCGMPGNDVEGLQCVEHFWQRVAGGCVSAG